MHHGKPSKGALLTYAALSLAISVLPFYSRATFRGLPDLDDLQKASGRVASVERGRYGIRFALDGVVKQFNYASKGNAVDLVLRTLTTPDRPVITVHFDPHDPVGAPGTDEAFYDVYQISTNGKVVRALDAVEAAWRSDQQFALWLSLFFVLNGGVLAWCAKTSESAT